MRFRFLTAFAQPERAALRVVFAPSDAARQKCFLEVLDQGVDLSARRLCLLNEVGLSRRDHEAAHLFAQRMREIENVLKNIEASQTMKRIIAKAQDLFAGTAAGAPQGAGEKEPARSPSLGMGKPYMQRLRGILQGIGISSESGSRDIMAIIEYLMENDMDITETTLNELCGRLGQNPKSVEQRIRRAAFAGMVNLANKGMEDYADPVFNEYAGRLYNFEQIRKEMNYIRGKSDKHGNVRIRNFISGLLAYCREM